MDTRPDDAMDTGSDAGAPGEHGAEPPLDPAEEVVLEDLLVTEPSSDVEVPAVEDSLAAAEAADDDSPLAALGPGGDDGDPDTPDFRAAD